MSLFLYLCVVCVDTEDHVGNKCYHSNMLSLGSCFLSSNPNIYSGCIAMARRDAVIQPNQVDPESDPEGEALEEIQTLQLQQDVSEWLVCLNNVSLFNVLSQLLPCS